MPRLLPVALAVVTLAAAAMAIGAPAGDLPALVARSVFVAAFGAALAAWVAALRIGRRAPS